MQPTRIMKNTLFKKFAGEIEHIISVDDPDVNTKQALARIHTETVSLEIMNLEPNKVLGTRAPEVHKSRLH